MEPSSLCLMLCLLFLQQLTFIAAQGGFTAKSCVNCTNSSGNYTSTSTYHNNLNTLLSAISTQIEIGYLKLSVGEYPNKVNGMAVCRGDLSVSECQDCVVDATKRLPTDCPTQKEAIGYYSTRCMLRYTDRPTFGNIEFNPNCNIKFSYKFSPSDVEKYRQKLTVLIDKLRINASAGDSRRKFAVGSENVTDSLKVYRLTQCNPDLSHSDCSNCLQVWIRQLVSCCSNDTGAGIYGPSCIVQFGNYPLTSNSQLLIPPPSVLPSNHTQSKPGKGWKSHKTWIVVVVLFIMLISLAALGWWLTRRSIKKVHKEAIKNNNVQITCIDSLQFDFSTIQDATDNFSDAKRLGKGSSTKVYKLPNNDQEIAVKWLILNEMHDELEYNNEVWLMANLQHRNLVKLLGF